MKVSDHADVQVHDLSGLFKDGRSDGAVEIVIQAGRFNLVRVVPPAGEEHAYGRVDWERRFTVYVSPTGRSVRLWIDNVEIELPKAKRRRVRRKGRPICP